VRSFRWTFAIHFAHTHCQEHVISEDFDLLGIRGNAEDVGRARRHQFRQAKRLAGSACLLREGGSKAGERLKKENDSRRGSEQPFGTKAVLSL
jgi:hypothetical protein